MTRLGVIAGAVFTMLLVFAAIGDVRTRRIPNRLVAAIALTGIMYSVITGGWALGALKGVQGFFLGMALWLAFYVLGWLGAGDVKLVAAAGAWLGPKEVIEGSLIAALLGAILALLWLFRSRGIRQAVETLGVATTLPSILTESPSAADRARSLPYSVPIAVGSLCAAWTPGLLIR